MHDTEAEYEQGYADGLAGRPRDPNQTDVFYRDGYEDGKFKRQSDAEDAR